jgi:putative membrane protein
MKTKSIHTLAAALLCALASLTLVVAPGHAADPKSILSTADETFVKTASQHGLGEAQIAALGVKKAAREDVKAIAEKMVTDHSAANTELAALAKSKGVMISVVTDPSDTKNMKDLENEPTGDAFDKAFLAQLEDDHKASIDLFEDAADDAKDAEVKAWAAKILPTLREHLKHVQEAQKK